MRLSKRLLLNGRTVPLGADRVELGLNRVGRAVLELLEPVQARRNPLVELYAAVAGQPEYLMLKGALMEVKRSEQRTWRATVHELATVLSMPLHLELRTPTAREVLARIEASTRLQFLVPTRAAYAERVVPLFASYGTAADALNGIARRWHLPDVVWYQLPDGQMYWGHWADGPYTKGALPVDAKLVTAVDPVQRTLLLPYIPALRPGMVVEAGFRFRIDALTFSGWTVQVTYTPV